MSQHSDASETNASRGRHRRQRGSYDTAHSEARACSSKTSGRHSKIMLFSPGSHSSSQVSSSGPMCHQQRDDLAANDSASHRCRGEAVTPIKRPTPENLGPGAEPPVAIASRAFAHEGKIAEVTSTFRSISNNKIAVEAPDGDNLGWLGETSGDGGALTVGVDCANVEETCARNMSLDKHPTLYSRSRDRADFSVPEIGSKSEEDETLPDSFNLSDEAGPEGASTGRGGGADDRKERKFIAGMKKRNGGARGGMGYSSDGSGSRCSTESDTVYDQGNRQNSGRGHYDNTSDGLSFSPPRRNHNTSRQQQQPWGRISRRRPFVESRKNRTNRIAPSEIAVDLGAEREGRRQRRGQMKGRADESPSGKASSAFKSNGHSRRSISWQRQRRRRPERVVLTEVESIAGDALELDRFEREMVRLRRENNILKRQQRTPSRNSEDARVNPWGKYNDHPSSRDVTCSNSRRRLSSSAGGSRPGNSELRDRDSEPSVHLGRRQSSKGLSYERDNPYHAVNAETRALPHHARNMTSRPESTTSWSEFVLNSSCSDEGRDEKNCASPGGIRDILGERRDELQVNGTVDLYLPRILVEGGFLWKIPCHTSGTPKRRWFQIKPAGGVLTTANGRLLVRPRGSGRAATIRGGVVDSAGMDETTDSCRAQLIHIQAAWPLCFIWMDPARDLERSPPREMGIEEIVDVARGHKTPAFWQQAAHRGLHTLPLPELCFSLIGHQRTLDLAAESVAEARAWVASLASVVLRTHQGQVSGCAPLSNRSLLSKNGRPPRGEEELSPRWPSNPTREDVTLGADDQRVTREIRGLAEEGGSARGRPYTPENFRTWRRRLFPAVVKGDIGAVVALFEQGCPVDLVEAGTGDTALLLACRLGDIGIAGECLRRGSKNDPHPDFGQTALQAAVAAGKEGCARLLLETAAPSMSDAVVANHKDPNRETPLHVASRRGFVEIVEALLHHGADSRLVDKEGNTALHGAAGRGHKDALASLLDAGGDALIEETNTPGNRPLHLAAAAGHMACVQLLLGTAAEPDMPNADGKTPFTLASVGGHLAVTRLIRQYAPAAGTVAGGDVQAQTSRQAGGGGDTLPRPHAPIWTQKCPATPERQRCPLRSGETFKEEVGAGGHETTGGRPEQADHRRTEFFSGYRRGRLWTTASPSTTKIDGPGSAPVHGSLFDGLSVYVVGGRQPLGSQQGTADTAATTSAGNDDYQSSYQHYHTAQVPQQHSSSSGYSHNFSSSSVPVNSLGYFMSEPSTVAPSPPNSSRTNSTVDTATVAGFLPGQNIESFSPAQHQSNAIPGSARALARMIHFSNGGAGCPAGRGRVPTFQTAVATRAGERDASSEVGTRDGGEQGVGAWMKSDGQQSTSTVDRTLHASGHGVVGISREHVTAVDKSNRVLSNKTHGDWSTTEQQVLAAPATAGGTAEEDQQSFVLSDGEVSLAGLWSIGYSQGYSYYVHTTTGHSQWEDPRPEKHQHSSTGGRTISQPSGVLSSETNNTVRESTTITHDKQHVYLVTSSRSPEASGSSKQVEDPPESQSWEFEQRLPASPITPVGITVAVEVPPFISAHAVPGNTRSRCAASRGEMEAGVGMPDQEIEDLRQGPLSIRRSSTESGSGSDASSTSSNNNSDSSSNNNSNSNTDMDSDIRGEESSRACSGTTPRNAQYSDIPGSTDKRGRRADSLPDEDKHCAIDLWRCRNSSPTLNWDGGSKEVHHESKRSHDSSHSEFGGSEAKEETPTF